MKSIYFRIVSLLNALLTLRDPLSMLNKALAGLEAQIRRAEAAVDAEINLRFESFSRQYDVVKREETVRKGSEARAAAFNELIDKNAETIKRLRKLIGA
jgi:hypothetical protein